MGAGGRTKRNGGSRHRHRRTALLGLCALGCAAQLEIETAVLPALPVPISNNAVATVRADGRLMLFSLLGLEQGKRWKDTSSKAFRLTLGEAHWSRLPDVPGEAGRLAATAVALRGKVYLFGGYTVAQDGAERSEPDVYELDPSSGSYRALAPMPVPVDDAVSLAYAERYALLVSGWHDTDNVALVQLYDAALDRWSEATPYPGAPVFGHAGGILGDRLIVCDGVRVVGGESGRRSFAITDACYGGRIDAADPRRIDWQALPPHPGAPRYRMAATGSGHGGGEVVFAGGTDNPYNYDGVGYDGRAAEPAAGVFAYSLDEERWKEYGRLDVATMDHRGLVEAGGRFHLIGGMRSGQRVTDGVIAFELPALRSND